MTDHFIIKKPLITDKSVALNQTGKYVFMVKTSATKNEIKKAVKEIYRVDALLVNIINQHPKTKMYRGLKSKRGGYKKAVVTLKKGQTIDLGR